MLQVCHWLNGCFVFRRVVLVSAVSPAACSRKPKVASPATAAPPTGPTEECFLLPLFSLLQKAFCKAKQKDTPPSQWATLGLLALLPPPPQVLISLLGSLLPPFFKIGCTCKIFMYVFIYTVYVIVEYEMWLLHFIFEGLFVYFFQNCRKRLLHYDRVGWWWWESEHLIGQTHSQRNHKKENREL